MWLWAWFLAGGWILAAGAVVVLGLVAAAVVVGATARKRSYAGRHETVVEQPAEQDFYGSMTLVGEYEARGWLSASPPITCMDDPLNKASFAPGDAPGWREQTAADLSPETLDAWGPPGPSESYEAWLAEGRASEALCGPEQPQEHKRSPGNENRDRDTDPGPGDLTSLAPGPDLTPWPFGFPPKHPERFRVVQAQAEPGPDTARLDWLGAQLDGHAAWARRMRGQVTGWGLEVAA